MTNRRTGGSTPFHLRPEASDSMLRKYPQYKHIFLKCPICGRNSLKPLGLNQIERITEVFDANEYKCTRCNFIHVKNLVVYTEPKSENSIRINTKIFEDVRRTEQEERDRRRASSKFGIKINCRSNCEIRTADQGKRIDT